MLIERIRKFIKASFKSGVVVTHHGRNFTITWTAKGGQVCAITFSRQPTANKLVVTINGSFVATHLVEKGPSGHMNVLYFEEAITECINSVKNNLK